MAAYPAILFDLDGTLVDSATGIAVALSALRAGRGGRPVSAATVRPLVSLGAETLVARALGPLAGDPGRDLAAFRAILGDLPADPAAIFPHVAETLRALGEAGHAMAVVTNKPEALARALLGDLGLSGHFAAIAGGDTAAFPKPHPAPVEWVLARLGIAAGDAVLVGDSAADAGAARATAMPFILYVGGYDADACAPADVAARFDDFARLPALVARFAVDRPREPA